MSEQPQDQFSQGHLSGPWALAADRDLGQGPRRAREREDGIVAAFVDLADGLVGDPDVQDVLHRLAEHCVALVGGSACGILLVDDRGSLSVLAAFPEAVNVLEVLQVQGEEGPCVDCVRSGAAVRSGDLRADADRWPSWAPVAMRGGVRSVYATPLRTRNTVIGTLNLFEAGPSGLAERDLLVVRALADVATLTILQQRHADAADLLNSQLQTALNSRIGIEQAKGLIAHSLTVDMAQAFQILRHNSRTTNTQLSFLADRLISGRVTPADLLPLPDRST